MKELVLDREDQEILYNALQDDLLNDARVIKELKDILPKNHSAIEYYETMTMARVELLGRFRGVKLNPEKWLK